MSALLESQQREREGFQRDTGTKSTLSVLKPLVDGYPLAIEGKEAEFRKLRVFPRSYGTRQRRQRNHDVDRHLPRQ